MSWGWRFEWEEAAYMFQVISNVLLLKSFLCAPYPKIIEGDENNDGGWERPGTWLGCWWVWGEVSGESDSWRNAVMKKEMKV